MKYLLNLSHKTRIFLFLLLMLSMTAAAYSGMAIYRVEARSYDVWMNPQPFPHPDYVIRLLNDHYERLYGPTPGFIKLHGELPRVRVTFLYVLVPAALISLILLQLVLAPWIFPSRAPRH